MVGGQEVLRGGTRRIWGREDDGETSQRKGEARGRERRKEKVEGYKEGRWEEGEKAGRMRKGWKEEGTCDLWWLVKADGQWLLSHLCLQSTLNREIELR